MIGNDIVDLVLAQKESNWKRKGFLDKIFTANEQFRIHSSDNPTQMVWNLWSRKEAAYKVYNRQTGVRGFFPLEIENFYESESLGTVLCKNQLYYTRTTIFKNEIHSIAVSKKELFDQIFRISKEMPILKINGIPFIKQNYSDKLIPVSISHHGDFWSGIMLKSESFF